MFIQIPSWMAWAYQPSGRSMPAAGEVVSGSVTQPAGTSDSQYLGLLKVIFCDFLFFALLKGLLGKIFYFF